MSKLGDLGIYGKLAMSNFQRHRFCVDLSPYNQPAVLGIKTTRMISLSADRFPTKVPGSLEMPLVNQENQVEGNLA
jgi:hypothetical protein